MVRGNRVLRRRSCSWLAICNGGCLKDRFVLAEDGERGLNNLCSGFRQFFAHAEQPLRRVTQLRKRGSTPDAILAELRAESRVGGEVSVGMTHVPAAVAARQSIAAGPDGRKCPALHHAAASLDTLPG